MGAYKIKWLACISLSIMLQKNVLVTRIASKKMHTKCPIRVSICVQSNSDVTDFVFLWSITRRTLDDLPCLYSFSKVILKLSHSARGHFVTLIQSDLHLMTCKLGHKNVATTEYFLEGFTRTAPCFERSKFILRSKCSSLPPSTCRQRIDLTNSKVYSSLLNKINENHKRQQQQ